MALAIKLNQMVREGGAGALAELGHISKGRLSQLLSLNHLAPEIQEELLFLPTTHRGADVITERAIRPIGAQVDWNLQRTQFQKLMKRARN